MNIELISIGDELLIGQTVNTNASYLGQTLTNIGANICRSSTISDNETEILTALKNIQDKVHCVIITGGLGPTKDDITKATLCKFFETDLKLHKPTLNRIENFFLSRNKPMLDANIRQAELPRNCEILENDYGTAAGMLFRKKETIFISLPGVPYEMKGIMEEKVVPILKEHFNLNSIYHKTALTQGIGESFLAEKIMDWENRIRASKLSLAYLPSPGLVKLRLTSYKGKRDQLLIDSYFKELKMLLPENVFGFNQDTLPSVVGSLLKQNHLTIGTVESCTAGYISSQIASVSGASVYFKGSFITYDNSQKMKLAKVSPETIEEHGAVSQEVVREMAQGGQKNLNVDVCIAVSGIAGPSGGSKEKPVGTVHIGIALKGFVFSEKFLFAGNRERNIQLSCLAALNLLRNKLISL